MSLDPLTAGLGLARDLVARIWPDKSEQERAELSAALVALQGQLDTNRAEAMSGSVFVAGWRPFVGWVCGLACAWNWIFLPMGLFAAATLEHPLQLRPADLGEMLPLLLGMLGLGTLRTIEKVKGAT